MRKWGDPVLSSRALEIDRFDDALREQIEPMGRIMDDALGIGLAATQVGMLQRVLVYRVEPERAVAGSSTPCSNGRATSCETPEEGCLSLPACWSTSSARSTCA